MNVLPHIVERTVCWQNVTGGRLAQLHHSLSANEIIKFRDICILCINHFQFIMYYRRRWCSWWRCAMSAIWKQFIRLILEILDVVFIFIFIFFPFLPSRNTKRYSIGDDFHASCKCAYSCTHSNGFCTLYARSTELHSVTAELCCYRRCFVFESSATQRCRGLPCILYFCAYRIIK